MIVLLWVTLAVVFELALAVGVGRLLAGSRRSLPPLTARAIDAFALEMGVADLRVS